METFSVSEGLVDRKPFNLDGGFVWLHKPKSGAARDTAIVICPGLKRDDLTGYSSFRLLADELAGAGYPVIRLQYPSTGNSSYRDDLEYFEACQHCVYQASEWLRSKMEIDNIILCGLRFGGMVAAAEAALYRNISGLILIEPVIRGRSYIRQLLVESKQVSGEIADIGEVKMPNATLNRIRQIDLRRMKFPPECKVAVYSHESDLVSESGESWKKNGSDVILKDLSGLEPFLRPTWLNHEEQADVTGILAWVIANFGGKVSDGRCGKFYEPSEMIFDKVTEKPLFFGAHKSLFGILSRQIESKNDMIVISGNAGGDPHVALASVRVARHIAERGIATLRFDFSGIGDSISEGIVPSHVFETNRNHDFTAAIDKLSELGYKNFAVCGACSGAYHAYHACLADDRIKSAVLINMPLFKWDGTQTLDDLTLEGQTPEQFLHIIASKEAWQKLFHGKVNVVKRIVWLANLAIRHIPIVSSKLKPTKMTSVINEVSALSRRVQMLFLSAEGDASVDMLQAEIGNAPRHGITIETISDIDHSITTDDMCDKVSSHIVTFLENI